MSRTYYLPVTVTLDGDPSSVIPSNLLLRDQADNPDPGLPRTVARQLFPFGYDFPSDTYAQADQVIGTLGVVDPVELWERSGAAHERNAPDDFIATISIAGPAGDPTGIASVTIIDANLQPRSASVLLGSAPSAPYRTRYGIPLLTGDRLLLAWDTPPVSGSQAFVSLNLTACDGSALQSAAAAWLVALKDCCDDTPPACDTPSAAAVTDDNGAITPLSVGGGGNPGSVQAVLVPPGSGVYMLDVTLPATFDPADYTVEVLVDGSAITPGAAPNFAAVGALPFGPPGTQDTWHVDFTLSAPSTADLIELRVTETANPSCTWTQGFLLLLAN